MNEISIPLSKLKMSLFVFLSVASVGLFSFLTVEMAIVFYSSKDLSFVAVIILTVLLVYLFGFLTKYYLTKMFENKPGLIINSKGIMDNAFFIGAGFIPWERITSLDTFWWFEYKYLIVNVKDADKIVSTQNGIRKWMMWLNWKVFGSPIALSSATIRCSYSRMRDLVSQGLRKYRENKLPNTF